MQRRVRIIKREGSYVQTERIYTGDRYDEQPEAKWDEIWEQQYEEDAAKFRRIERALELVNKRIGTCVHFSDFIGPGISVSTEFLKSLPPPPDMATENSVRAAEHNWQKAVLILEAQIDLLERKVLELSDSLRRTKFLESYGMPVLQYDLVINRAANLRFSKEPQITRDTLKDGSFAASNQKMFWLNPGSK
jgi:hypothetical protein